MASLSMAKVVECQPNLTENMNNRWAFCTKMAFAKDNLAKVKAIGKFNGKDLAEEAAAAKHVQLFVYKEEHWERILRDTSMAEGRVTCDKMGNYARFRDLIYFDEADETPQALEFQRYVEF